MLTNTKQKKENGCTLSEYRITK